MATIVEEVGQSIQRVPKSFNQLKCHHLALVVGKYNYHIHISSGMNHFLVSLQLYFTYKVLL